MVDHYQILKLNHGCTKDEIQQAYHAALFNKPKHLNTLSEEKWFEQIQSAYEYLSKRSVRRIQYTSKDILLNGLYVNCNGRSYILSDYDKAMIRKGSEPPYILAGMLLIIIGILTIPFFVGPAIIAAGVCALFIKNYFLILVSQEGDTQLIHGNKFRMKKISRKINLAMKEFAE